MVVLTSAYIQPSTHPQSMAHVWSSFLPARSAAAAAYWVALQSGIWCASVPKELIAAQAAIIPHIRMHGCVGHILAAPESRVTFLCAAHADIIQSAYVIHTLATCNILTARYIALCLRTPRGMS